MTKYHNNETDAFGLPFDYMIGDKTYAFGRITVGDTANLANLAAKRIFAEQDARAAEHKDINMLRLINEQANAEAKRIRAEISVGICVDVEYVIDLLWLSLKRGSPDEEISREFAADVVDRIEYFLSQDEITDLHSRIRARPDVDEKKTAAESEPSSES